MYVQGSRNDILYVQDSIWYVYMDFFNACFKSVVFISPVEQLILFFYLLLLIQHNIKKYCLYLQFSRSTDSYRMLTVLTKEVKYTKHGQRNIF